MADGEEVDIECDAAAARVAFDNDLRAGCFEVTRLARQATFVRDLTEDALHRAGVERGMRVLDLGCGTGDTSLLLAKLVGASGLVVGVDPSAEAIHVAEKRATVPGSYSWTGTKEPLPCGCFPTKFVPTTFVPSESSRSS